MKLDPDGDWIGGARQVLSPNCDERPHDGAVCLLVVHSISLPPGEYGGAWIEDLFTNRLDGSAHPYFAQICDLKVSSHVLIRRDGELVQYVPFSKRAWHAGASCYHGREACNDFSIGIELEGQEDETYEEIQYQRLAELIGTLRKQFPALGEKDLVGHSDIAPGRKTDPGPAFDWPKLHALLKL